MGMILFVQVQVQVQGPSTSVRGNGSDANVPENDVKRLRV